MGREAMSKRVRMGMTMCKAGPFCGVLASIPNYLGGDGTAARVPAVTGEQPLCRLTPQTAPIFTKRMEQPLAQHNVAVTGALAAMNVNNHPAAIDVRDL